jgi:hypothetical protein
LPNRDYSQWPLLPVRFFEIAERAKSSSVDRQIGQVRVAGGYAQTAGHAPLSSKYGLAADNMLEYKVVTSDGKLRIANMNSEPDLFFALRGGGGGERLRSID